MKKLKKLAIIGFVLVIILGVTLHFVTPSLVKTAVETSGTDALETNVAVENVSLSLFTSTAELNGLAIQNLDGFELPNLFTAKGIHLEVSPMSMMSSPVVIGAIVIDEPVFSLEAALTSTNLTRLLSQLSKKQSAPAPTEEKTESEPTELKIQVVRIIKPKVIVSQSAIGSDTDSLELDTIEIKDWETTTIGGVTFRILGEVVEAVAKKNKIPPALLALLKSDILNVEGLENLGGILEGVGELGTTVGDAAKDIVGEAVGGAVGEAVGGAVTEGVKGAGNLIKGLIPKGKGN